MKVHPRTVSDNPWADGNAQASIGRFGVCACCAVFMATVSETGIQQQCLLQHLWPL